MESEPLILHDDRLVTGFTLELDGNPWEIGRIVSAALREMSKIQMENANDKDYVFGRRWPILGRLNVKGKITYRKAI